MAFEYHTVGEPTCSNGLASALQYNVILQGQKNVKCFNRRCKTVEISNLLI